MSMLVFAACGGTATEPVDETGESTAEARTCNVMALCVQGYTWSAKACSCVPDKGPKCGTKQCGAKEYCCNASCGICAPLGSACIMIACVPK